MHDWCNCLRRPVERAVFMMFVFVVEYCGIPRCKIHVLREIDLRSLIAPTRTGLYSVFLCPRKRIVHKSLLPTIRYRMWLTYVKYGHVERASRYFVPRDAMKRCTARKPLVLWPQPGENGSDPRVVGRRATFTACGFTTREKELLRNWYKSAKYKRAILRADKSAVNFHARARTGVERTSDGIIRKSCLR